MNIGNVGPYPGASQTVGGSTLPSSPTARSVFMKTSGGSEGLYVCLSNGAWTLLDTSAHAGTVTSVSVTTANGVSGSVANPTTTPAITLTLGAITPTSVNGLTVTTSTGTLTVANLKTLTVSNTLTLAGTDGTTMTFPSTSQSIPGLSRANTFSANGALSAPAVNFTGTPITSGTGTTTFPLFDINTSGATARTAMSTSGTMLGINAPSGFAGNFMDFSSNGAASVFKVNSAGNITAGSAISTGTLFAVSGSWAMQGPSSGVALLSNSSVTGHQTFAIGGAAPAAIGTAPTHGQTYTVIQSEELLTVAAAATSTTAMQIPANAVVLSASVRVTVVIPTATTFTVTVGGTTFSTAAVSSAANSTDPGTKAGAFFNSTAQGVVITPDLTPGANTGRVRVTVTYYLITPATS